MDAAALEAMDEFFNAPDLVSKANFVKDGKRVLPMMQDYYGTREHPLPAFGRISKGKEADFGGDPMVFFEIASFKGPRYHIAVVWNGERFVVDWESLTAYGTMDWSDFIEDEPVSAQEMRVFVLEARGIPTVPGTPEDSAVFRIEHRDHPQPLIATASAELAAILRPLVEGRRAPVTLELAWKPEGPGGAPIPVIIRMIAKGWTP